jgi:hypothetical protein
MKLPGGTYILQLSTHTPSWIQALVKADHSFCTYAVPIVSSVDAFHTVVFAVEEDAKFILNLQEFAWWLVNINWGGHLILQDA